MTDRTVQLWQAMDAARSRGQVIDESALAALLAKQKGRLQPDELDTLLTALSGGALDWLRPEPVRQFVAALLNDTKGARVLDPCAGSGTLLIRAAQQLSAPNAVGVVPRANGLAVAQSLSFGGTLSLRTGDPVKDPGLLEGVFDVIVTCTPFGGRRTEELCLEFPTGTLRFRGSYAEVLVLRSLEHLAKDGVGLFVVSPGVWSGDRSEAWRAALEQMGMSIDAHFTFPPGTFAPLTSIPGILLRVRHGPRPKLFVGEVGEDREHWPSLLSNLARLRADPNPRLGAVVDPATFVSFDAFLAERRCTELARKTGLPLVSLRDIVVEARRLPKGAEHHLEADAAVYLPEAGARAAVASLSELTGKHAGYLQLVCRPDLVESEYLARLLNTEFGLALRDRAIQGLAAPKLNTGQFLKQSLPLPDLATQRSILGLAQEIRGLRAELGDLESGLFDRPKRVAEFEKALRRVNHEDRFEEWLEMLPFPLASILWTFHCQTGPKARYETLLHFFEACAEFHAIILMSGLLSTLHLEVQRKDFATFLSEKQIRLDHASFGSWQQIGARLAKQFRAQLNDGSNEGGRQAIRAAFRTRNDRALSMLFDGSLFNLLGEANHLRNTWLGHSGFVDDRAAEHRLATLTGHLTRYRELAADHWLSLPLFQPRTMKFVDGHFSTTADCLMGSRTPFRSETIATSVPLEDGRLHILAQGEDTALALLPLVRMMTSPTSAQNACYFYSRQDGSEVRFVAYHFTSEADVVGPFQDATAAIGRLRG